MASNQFAISNAIQQRNFVKSIQVLLGICSGLVADGKINDDEIMFLTNWINEHPEVAQEWPGNVIANRLNIILADGIVTNEEREDLISALQELSGNYFTDTGVTQQDTPALPIDNDITITISGATVCFTGQFVFGTRTACQNVVSKVGGIPVDSITKQLDYLIIGSLASPDWINTSYGRKIEKAVAYRTDYGRPIIISEKQWLDSLQKN